MEPAATKPTPNARRSRFRLGLLSRLILALLAVGAIPLIAVTFSLQGVFAPALTRQTQNNHILVARAAADRLAAEIAWRQALGESVARNPAVQGDPFAVATQGLVAGLLQGRPEVAAIRLQGADGRELLRVQRREFADEVDRALEAQLDPEEGPIVVQGALSLWLRQDFPFPVPGEEGSVVQLITEAGFLGELFRPEEIGDQAEMVLVDRGRSVLAGSVPSLDAFPEAVVARAVTGALSGSEIVETPDGEPIITAYFPVEGSRWVILSVQPQRVAQAAADQLRSHSLSALAASLLMSGLVAFFGYASLVKPLRRVLASQREMLGAQAKGLVEGNEIQELQENFQLLQRRLRSREKLGDLFLGRYRVDGVLGEGGMGTVLRCKDTALARPVAIKTFRLSDSIAEMLTPEERRERIVKLRQEAVANARINHPNVVALYDVVDQGEVAFLVMELVEGASLEALLDRRSLLTPEEVAHLGLEVALGLQAAHGEGLVHHDLKPGNILLGHDGAIKLVDFGIAKFVSEVTPSTDKVFGTPGYIPPEAVRGGPYNQAGDYFALGVVLYYALTGRLPFTGRTVRDILVATLLDEPIPPSRFVPDLPEGLERAILGLLEKEEETRQAVGRGLVAELRGIEGRQWQPEKLDFEGGASREDPDKLYSRLYPTLSGSDLESLGTGP
jgi:serine/threonine-protein kinase